MTEIRTRYRPELVLGERCEKRTGLAVDRVPGVDRLDVVIGPDIPVGIRRPAVAALTPDTAVIVIEAREALCRRRHRSKRAGDFGGRGRDCSGERNLGRLRRFQQRSVGLRRRRSICAGRWQAANAAVELGRRHARTRVGHALHSRRVGGERVDSEYRRNKSDAKGACDAWHRCERHAFAFFIGSRVDVV